MLAFHIMVKKGPVTISIRQHYTFDDGVSRPTKKVINLKKKEWEALISVMDLIGESIDNLKSEFVFDGKMVVKSVCVYFSEKKMLPIWHSRKRGSILQPY